MSFAVLCPGQGAQTQGFLSPVLRDNEDLRHSLEEVLCLSFDEINALTSDALRVNAVAQPSITAFQLALWAQLGPHLPRPTLAAGYSLGEVIAVAIAGGIDPPRAISLARKRALLMDAAYDGPSAMLAVRGLLRHTLETLIQPLGGHIAICNGEDRYVVAGPTASMALVEAAASALGASVTAVAVSTPSHTPLLQPAASPFRAALAQVMRTDLAFPVVSALDSTLIRQGDQAVEFLSRQLAEPLDWVGVMDTLVERGIQVCLELGPGADLSRMLRERHPAIVVRSVQEFATAKSAILWVREKVEE